MNIKKQKILDDVKNYKELHISNLVEYITGKNKNKVYAINSGELEVLLSHNMELTKLGYNVLGEFTDIDEVKDYVKSLGLPNYSILIGFKYCEDHSLEKVVVCECLSELSEETKALLNELDKEERKILEDLGL